MSRVLCKGRRYGLASGISAVAAGWLIVTFLLPTSEAIRLPHWQWSLIVYSSTNILASLDFLHILGLDGLLGRPSTLYRNPIRAISEMPFYVYYIPIVASGVAAIVTCFQTSSKKIRDNISNALAAGSGCFLAAIGLTAISNIDPMMSIVYAIGFVIALGFWIGSAFIGNRASILFVDITVIGSLVAAIIMSLISRGAVAAVVFGLFALPIVTSLGVGSVIGSVRWFGGKDGEGADSSTLNT